MRGAGGFNTVTGIEDVERTIFDRYNTVLHELTHWALGHINWSVTLSFAVALWLFRWASGSDPHAEEIIPIIGCLDRSQGYAPLVGIRHRRRVNTLAQDGQLQRLVAWYAR